MLWGELNAIGDKWSIVKRLNYRVTTSHDLDDVIISQGWTGVVALMSHARQSEQHVQESDIVRKGTEIRQLGDQLLEDLRIEILFNLQRASLGRKRLLLEFFELWGNVALTIL